MYLHFQSKKINIKSIGSNKVKIRLAKNLFIQSKDRIYRGKLTFRRRNLRRHSSRFAKNEQRQTLREKSYEVFDPDSKWFRLDG